MFFVKLFSDYEGSINLYASAIFQSGGGILVISTINDNLNLLKGKSILSSVLSWFKRFPLKRRITTATINATLPPLRGKFEVRAIPKLDTIDQKVEYLLEEIKRIHKKISLNNSALEQGFNQKIDELRDKLNIQTQNITEVESKLQDSIAGEVRVKLEILGVLLVLYGIFIPVIWGGS